MIKVGIVGGIGCAGAESLSLRAQRAEVSQTAIVSRRARHPRLADRGLALGIDTSPAPHLASVQP